MKKKYGLWIAVGIFMLIFVLPYAKVEILTVNAEEKLKAFDISCFDNVYGAGTPEVYDCKIYSYWKENRAKALYILGDCEFGVMVELKWNHDENCWELESARNMWTIHGGNAQEFYWPLYYGDKLYPLLEE